MSEFCIIGSGISGSTIANLLNKKYSVILFDKARGPGGRASFKRIKGKTGFDHGTQYISPKTKEFKKFTKDLIKKRILKVWRGKHVFLNSKKKEDKKHLKVIGKNGNNDISKHLLKKINCNYHSELKKIYYKNKLWYLLFDDGKYLPKSPLELAPKIASQIACITTSPSLCPNNPLLKGISTPPKNKLSPGDNS